MNNPAMLKKLMQQAQRAQKELTTKMQEFEQTEFDFVFGADHVKTTMKGDGSVTKIQLHPDLLSDRDMLEDILVDAINEALGEINAKKEAIQSQAMSGMAGMKGLF